ncbi:MAG: hypothetical protein ACLFUY_09580 [Desulfobacterales bacterium]
MTDFRNRCLQAIVFAAAALVLMMLFISPAMAHRVTVFAWIEDQTVHTVSKFPGGNKISGGTIKVYDDAGNLLVEGKTDEQGEFSFPIPENTALKIVMSAGPGHQGQWRLAEKEVRAALAGEQGSDTADTAGKKEDPAEENAPAEKTETPAAQGSSDTSRETASAVNRAVDKAVKDAVEDALDRKLDEKLDRKLAPVMRMLSDLKDPGPSANEIFGGIGYIVGLFGVAAYIYSRRR